MSDLLDFPKKVRFYSKINLCSTYHLVCIAEGDKWKTMFHTWYSSFEWLVMPGLSNVPSAFQQLMNKVFADLLDVSVVIYLDNILIYSNNLLEHKKYIKEVLRHLRNNRLYASLTKCIFHQQEVEFLGYILSPEGLQMNKSKVQVNQDWPVRIRISCKPARCNWWDQSHHILLVGMLHDGDTSI